MAAKDPRTIDAIDINIIICCHCSPRLPKGTIITLIISAIAAILGATEKNAVTGVGAP